MKQPFSRANEHGQIEYRCTVHGYLLSDNFFKSDIAGSRASCKSCTTARARASKSSDDPARIVLAKFKTYAIRHKHTETKLWEPSDVAPVLGTCNVNDVVLRPIDFNAVTWYPHLIKTVPIAEARTKSYIR